MAFQILWCKYHRCSICHRECMAWETAMALPWYIVRFYPCIIVLLSKDGSVCHWSSVGVSATSENLSYLCQQHCTQCDHCSPLETAVVSLVFLCMCHQHRGWSYCCSPMRWRSYLERYWTYIIDIDITINRANLETSTSAQWPLCMYHRLYTHYLQQQPMR